MERYHVHPMHSTAAGRYDEEVNILICESRIGDACLLV
jgi:hypothetical protein